LHQGSTVGIIALPLSFEIIKIACTSAQSPSPRQRRRLTIIGFYYSYSQPQGLS
jgi:hypothetical protein